MMGDERGGNSAKQLLDFFSSKVQSFFLNKNSPLFEIGKKDQKSFFETVRKYFFFFIKLHHEFKPPQMEQNRNVPRIHYLKIRANSLLL